MNLKKSVLDLQSRAKKALINVMSVSQSIGTFTPSIFFKLFDSQIQSIMLYGSEIWGFQRYECLEKLHLLACKRFLNVGQATPNCMVYGECGRYPVFKKSQSRCLKYWLKITNTHEQRIPKKLTTC